MLKLRKVYERRATYMWVNRYASSSAIYAKLAEKYAQLDKIDNQERTGNFNKVDRVELSTAPAQYDEQDYHRVLNKFQQKDNEIRAHEQAHAANGPTASGIVYNYQMGPDGKLYAVGGHVRMDTSIPNDPQAASYKLGQLQRAASSPNELSGADAQIARTANLNKMLLHSLGESNAS